MEEKSSYTVSNSKNDIVYSNNEKAGSNNKKLYDNSNNEKVITPDYEREESYGSVESEKEIIKTQK